MVDVLHHVEFPTAFFSEAQRVLRHGGRIIMVEPAITLVSNLFYRLLHHEAVVTSADPLTIGTPNPDRDPHEANQAIPTLIATKYRHRFHELFPALRMMEVDWFSLAAYPMSGGFKSWSLLSTKLARRMLRIERVVEPIVGRFIAFRMLLIFEKREIAA
jgi:SAM-dependent methyltransferase